MKKVLQFSGIISVVVGVIGLVLLLATNAIIVGSGSLQVVTKGTTAIFGAKTETIIGTATTNPSVLALIGFILTIVGLVVVCCGVVLPLLKVKGIEKFAGLINLVAIVCFVVAGVFAFLVVPSFYGANNSDVPNNAVIGAGWVIGGILLLVAGGFAILPTAADFLGKKKRR